MELSNQIRKYRKELNLSQEELAEKIYVTRQTISNWENGKNYPDIHSLLLLSSLFDRSLDQLIKGDLDMMKEEIKKENVKEFNLYGTIYAVLFLVCMVAAAPIIIFFSWYGMIALGILFAILLFFAFKLEKMKKKEDVQTYKEIIAFTKGERLDEIAKNQEYGKRPYQKFLLAVGAGILTFVVFTAMAFLCSRFV